MIQKKSKEESTGEGSGQSRNASHVHTKTRALLLGVEILKNEPYTNGPNGTDGQYTEKLYHVQSHLPGWVSSFLSKGIFSLQISTWQSGTIGAFAVKECSWNAYPYTKTKFTISSFEKFSILIETRFLSDAGTAENVFNLSEGISLVLGPLMGSKLCLCQLSGLSLSKRAKAERVWSKK